MNGNTPSAGHKDHVVVFYADDREFTGAVGEFLGGGLWSDGVAVAIATHSRRLALASFMVNDWPDPAAFWQVISPVIQHASGTAGPVRVFGELVALLWESGQAGAAIDVEALWNEMASRYSFSLLCGYSAQSVSSPELSDALTQVCLAHTRTAGVSPEVGQATLPG